MLKSLSLILLLLCLYTSNVYSETFSGTPNQTFRPMARKHVDILLKRGIKKIGNLNLLKLAKELNTVEWRTFEIGFLVGSNDERSTSIYIVKDRMVIVNFLSFQNLAGQPVHVYSWALHEGLGALGYNDENYELSASISFLAENSHLASLSTIYYLDEQFEVTARSRQGRNYVNAGGSTIVGGGGDAIIIELKQRLLKRYFDWITINFNELSNEEIKKGFNSLIKFKMETYLRDNSDYKNMTFWLEGQTFYIGAGVARFYLKQLYEVETLDRILETLKDYL